MNDLSREPSVGSEQEYSVRDVLTYGGVSPKRQALTSVSTVGSDVLYKKSSGPYAVVVSEDPLVHHSDGEERL